MSASDAGSAGGCPVHGAWTRQGIGGCPKCHGQEVGIIPYVDDHVTVRPVGDARAQLWVRVYAAEFELYRRRDGAPPETIVYMRTEGQLRETTALACAQRRACDTANAAVRDFDEHYLGGKR